MAAVGMAGKGAPAEHNLVGVDVLAGAGLGMVDTPSIVVDMEAAGMAYLDAHLHSVGDMAYFALDARTVVEAHVAEEFAVEGFVVVVPELVVGSGPAVEGYSELEYSE